MVLNYIEILFDTSCWRYVEKIERRSHMLGIQPAVREQCFQAQDSWFVNI